MTRSWLASFSIYDSRFTNTLADHLYILYELPCSGAEA